jgi:hypothetical protein
MPESTVDPTQTGITVLNTDGTPTGTRLYLDHVKDNGIMYIITRWNFRGEIRTNEFDGTQYQMHVFNEAWIKTWSIPGSYIKNDVEIKIGTPGPDGKLIVTKAEAEDYIRENALEIAGFGQTSKINYIR